MNYLDRSLVCKRLALSQRQSYRIVPPAYGALINSDEVLHIVNEARRGIREPLNSIPCDMVTAEELAADPVLGGVVQASRIITWTHRTKNVPPHFRFNKKTTRFSRGIFIQWLDSRSRIRKSA